MTVMKEVIETVYEDERVRVEKIFSYGCVSPDGFWYEQSEGEYAIVTTGEAVLKYRNGKEIRLQAGEGVFIKRAEAHRVDYTSKDCEWLCIFLK